MEPQTIAFRKKAPAWFKNSSKDQKRFRLFDGFFNQAEANAKTAWNGIHAEKEKADAYADANGIVVEGTKTMGSTLSHGDIWKAMAKTVHGNGASRRGEGNETTGKEKSIF